MKNRGKSSLRMSVAAVSLLMGLGATVYASPVLVSGVSSGATEHSAHHRWMQEFGEGENYMHGYPPVTKDVHGFHHINIGQGQEGHDDHSQNQSDNDNRDHSEGNSNPTDHFTPFGSSTPPGLERLGREWKPGSFDEDGHHFTPFSSKTPPGFEKHGHEWKHESSEDISSVPVPPAVWLFGSGLLGLIGVARRENNSRRNGR